MSGHSKWATIKRSKGATDAKRGVLFTKLSKNISIAAKKGKDPAMNPSLRLAIDAARAANMSKDVVERAILRGAGELPGQQIEELTYECYGPGGIALLVKCATDNNNRTASFIKSTLSQYGGNLGGPGSVTYLLKPGTPPAYTLPLTDPDLAQKFQALLEELEDNEDVVEVTHNAQN